MKKPELLLPGGSIDCIRAAANNGADAIYLGLTSFNARMSAGNIGPDELPSIVEYCHKRNVKVYVTLNTLVKNDEVKDFLILAKAASCADALIIQDVGMIPLLRKNTKVQLHLSTQATTTNTHAIPEVDRVILPRETSLEQVKRFSEKIETEVFVHGALCISYSGQCLFSAMVGGRSGNRGRCAQPCRRLYNNAYNLSAKDLCLIGRIPELIKAGVCALKVEGRMRSPTYVWTVARIYRKAIDLEGDFKHEKKDIDDLLAVFNRGFTEGYAFEERIISRFAPSNRGLYLGKSKGGWLILKKELFKGDGIGVRTGDDTKGWTYEGEDAKPGESVNIGMDGDVYKTSSSLLKVEMGDEVRIIKSENKTGKVSIPDIKENKGKKIEIYVKAMTRKDALSADDAGAELIYYDIMKEDFSDVRDEVKAKVFAWTPAIVDDTSLMTVAGKIEKIRPDGILAGERGILKLIQGLEVHLDQSFNIFNDHDIAYFGKVPVISPELSIEDIGKFKQKDIIVQVHGNMVLMRLKEPLKAPELVDEEGRHFKVRENSGVREILNFKELGLFNKILEYKEIGVTRFLIETKDPGKLVRIYRNILDGKTFDDTKIRKGYTTGNFSSSVS